MDVENKDEIENYEDVLSVLKSFGTTALPIIAIDTQVVCMGLPKLNEIVEAVKTQLNVVRGLDPLKFE